MKRIYKRIILTVVLIVIGPVGFIYFTLIFGTGDLSQPFDCRVMAAADSDNCMLCNPQPPAMGCSYICRPVAPIFTICPIKMPQNPEQCEELYYEYAAITIKRNMSVMHYTGYEQDRCLESYDEEHKIPRWPYR